MGHVGEPVALELAASSKVACGLDYGRPQEWLTVEWIQGERNEYLLCKWLV